MTALYGGTTAISFGSSREHLDLMTGTSIDFTARWSATLIKEDGKWLIANLHASSNLFDNPLLAMAKQMSYIVGGVCLLAGVIVGFLLGRRRKAAP